MTSKAPKYIAATSSSTSQVAASRTAPKPAVPTRKVLKSVPLAAPQTPRNPTSQAVVPSTAAPTPNRRKSTKKRAVIASTSALEEYNVYIPPDAWLEEQCNILSAAPVPPDGRSNAASSATNTDCLQPRRTSAVLYRELARETKDRYALFTIGWMYYFGLGGCPKEHGAAWRYFVAAAQQSHTMALYYCGLMTERGEGGNETNVSNALAIYKMAAERNEKGSDLAACAAARLLENQPTTSAT